jgi:DNA-directed RNA polymerase specialized sigma24 family protein
VADAQERNPLFLRLEECLSKLPDTLRGAVQATYYQAQNSDEAATSLGTSAASVRKRLERARSLLRQCIQGDAITA